MVHNILAGLLALLGLVSVGVCLTYNGIGDVPHLDWDFIIVGGESSSEATLLRVPIITSAKLQVEQCAQFSQAG